MSTNQSHIQDKNPTPEGANTIRGQATPEHSSLPWKYKKNPKIGAYDNCEISTIEIHQHTPKWSGPKFIGNIYDTDDAKFVIKACNSYYTLKELVEAIRLLLKNNVRINCDLALDQIDVVLSRLNKSVPKYYHDSTSQD